jgi:hypothetical protein
MIIFALVPSTFTMAGLLTFPDLMSFPSRQTGTVDNELIKSLNGITAAGTVPDSHRIPF